MIKGDSNSRREKFINNSHIDTYHLYGDSNSKKLKSNVQIRNDKIYDHLIWKVQNFWQDKLLLFCFAFSLIYITFAKK